MWAAHLPGKGELARGSLQMTLATWVVKELDLSYGELARASGGQLSKTTAFRLTTGAATGTPSQRSALAQAVVACLSRRTDSAFWLRPVNSAVEENGGEANTGIVSVMAQAKGKE